MKKIFPIFLLMVASIQCQKESLAEYKEFTDLRDGNNYKTIQIGSQIWLAENLRYLPVINSPEDTSDTQARYFVYAYYGEDIIEAETTYEFQIYGVLYNLNAAKTACPEGWHLSTDTEWQSLEKLLGMERSWLSRTGLRYNGFIGTKLKSKSGWNNDGNGNNSSGFSAIPGGLLNDIAFNNLGSIAYFWASSEDNRADAWYRNLFDENSYVGRGDYDSNYSSFAFSVRCIKD